MNANSENNSDKEKEAEIAANQLVGMLRQQAIYDRVAKINANTKSASSEEENSKPFSFVNTNSSRLIYFKWAVAASVVMGLFLFLVDNNEPPKAEFATINTSFRGTNSLQSRSVINGAEIRTYFADIDDLIDTRKLEDALAVLDKMEADENLKRTAPVNYRQGIIALERQDFVAASQAFRKTVDSSDREYIENAYWNLFLSHLELKNVEAAKMVAKEMSESPHITEKQKKESQALVQM